MTKTQIRAKLKKLLDQLGDIKAELYDLQSEVQDTRDNIEPYEGCYDLTPEQEERQEWLDDLDSSLDTVISNLEDCEYELEEK